MSAALHERHERQLAKYGLTEEQWQALWDACGGHCPACTKPFASNRLPCVDHDHLSGLVRGLLCQFCNTEVGVHHDNAGWFLRTGKYLINPPAIAIIGEVFVPGSIGAHRAEG